MTPALRRYRERRKQRFNDMEHTIDDLTARLQQMQAVKSQNALLVVRLSTSIVFSRECHLTSPRAADLWDVTLIVCPHECLPHVLPTWNLVGLGHGLAVIGQQARFRQFLLLPRFWLHQVSRIRISTSLFRQLAPEQI